jgi:hypothetical protein
MVNGQKHKYGCNFWSISMLLDPETHSQLGTDPDPGHRQPNKCGPMRFRIHKTAS